MAQGSDPTRWHGRPSWRTSLRRGVILGGVTALHLATLALILRPVPPYRHTHSIAHDVDAALQINFLLAPAQPRALHVSTSPRPGKIGPQRRRRIVAPLPSPLAVALPARPFIIAVPTNASGYRRSAAFDDAQRTQHFRLPGTRVSPGRSFPFHDRPSMRELMRSMTTASRCKYERMKMEKSTTQFVTRQLVERALDADGCGAPAMHNDADATIDAISRAAIFNH